MNETDLLNASINATQNETVRQNIDQAGRFALDNILNSSWGNGIAQWLNSTLNTNAFTGSIVTALIPIITILFFYWKWQAIVQAVGTMGSTILVLIMLFVALKAFGVI